MPRIPRCRKICFEPQNRIFIPKTATTKSVTIFLEELEAIRLVDGEEMEQENAANMMEVSRQTFQRILYSARKKVADALTMGLEIKIEGGNYSLYQDCKKQGHCKCCPHQKNSFSGGKIMIIAVTTQQQEVFQHFGSCKEFTLYHVENGTIVEKPQTLDTSQSGHGALAALMEEKQVNILICGGIGQGAKNALHIRGIEIVAGVSGKVDDAVKRYLSGELVGNPDFVCSHNHESGEDHGCGHHTEHEDGPNHTCHCS